jgi:hypothetical protein
MKALLIIPLLSSVLYACPTCDKTRAFIEFSLDDLYQMRAISEKNPALIEEVKYIDGSIFAYEEVKHLLAD